MAPPPPEASSDAATAKQSRRDKFASAPERQVCPSSLIEPPVKPSASLRRSVTTVEVAAADELTRAPLLPVHCGQCKAQFCDEAKFCFKCGEKRPRPKPPGSNRRISAVEEDCVHEFGCRRTVWLFFHGEVKETPCILRFSEKYEMFTIALVLYLVVSDIIASIPEVGKMFHSSKALKLFEAFIYIVFTVEYLARLWSCMESKALAELGSLRGRLKLMRGVIEMVDLVVLVAYYINFIPGFSKLKGLSALRMIRLLRVAALLKVERKTSSFSKIVKVLKNKKSELCATLFTAAVLMVMSATMMYYLETETQPDSFSSVPAAMWWAVTTLTTVGYGDVVPKTNGGKLLGGIVAFFGVGLFALPAGILGSGFVEEVDKDKMAAQEFSMEEEAFENALLEEEEEECNMIAGLVRDMDMLQNTVTGLQDGQQYIYETLRNLCPGFDGETPPSPTRKKATTHDEELHDIQQSVLVRMGSLKRNKPPERQESKP